MRDWWDRNGDAVIGGALSFGVAIVGGILLGMSGGGSPRRNDDDELTGVDAYACGMIMREHGQAIPHGASREMRDGAADWHTLTNNLDTPFRRPDYADIMAKADV